MAINETFFWDGNNLYGQSEVCATFRGIMRSGIMGNEDGTITQGKVTAGSGKVTVSPVFAHVDGTFLDTLDTNKTTTLTVATPTTYPRIDRVVIRADFSARTTSIVLKSGEESSSPVEPTLSRQSGVLYEIPLARVRVETSGSMTVTDERTSDACGEIRAKGMSEFNAYASAAKSSFENWFSNAETSKRNIFIQDSEPLETDDVAPKAGDIWIAKTSDPANAFYVLSSAKEWEQLALATKADNVVVTKDDGTTELSHYLAPGIFGAALASDIVGYTDKLQNSYIPLTKAETGFTISSSYAELSSGKIKITKGGFYNVSAMLLISDNSTTRSTGVLITVNGNAFIESENAMTWADAKTVTASRLLRLNAGDTLTLIPRFTGGNGLVRIGAMGSTGYKCETAVELYPVYLD